MSGRKGTTQIAKQLKNEQVFTPGYYYYNKTGVLLTNVDVTRPYDWNSRTAADILEDVVYLGHTISLKYTTVSYKNKKRIKRPESDQLRFENTHKPMGMYLRVLFFLCYIPWSVSIFPTLLLRLILLYFQFSSDIQVLRIVR